jgi:hypothetical protein
MVGHHFNAQGGSQSDIGFSHRLSAFQQPLRFATSVAKVLGDWLSVGHDTAVACA